MVKLVNSLSSVEIQTDNKWTNEINKMFYSFEMVQSNETGL